ncbi:MAG: restriction endonuclease subunit S [Deltaproteobacteria bacterium]|nr:restriction endonuclease subunit S [Candidatus Tharpella aukensis]
MSAKWKEYRLGDLTDWYSGGTPSKKRDEYWNGDIPWISASSMYGSRYSDSKLKITEEGLKAGSKIVPEDTVLLLVRGSSLHQRIPVGISLRPVSFNQDVKGIRIKDNVLKDEILDPWFLLYWLISQQYNLLQMVENTGIGAGKFDTKQLQDLILKVPDKEERELIVATAKSIDDKIELNRCINQTLEQIAQAIFKSWFVDFEPVKAKIAAKENGRNPERAAMSAISGKSDTKLNQLPADQLSQLATTAALFPDELVESELGLIPKGWQVKPLDEIAHYQNGLALQKFRPENENNFLPVVKIAQLKKGMTDSNEKASPNINPACVIDNGDVVFSWSGSLMVDLWCGGKAALNQHLFKVTSDSFPKWFYYFWTKHHLAIFQQIAADKAVTMGHIKRSHLREALCTTPNVNLKLFDLIGKLLSQQIGLRLECMTLTNLRDTLLPKLLYGEISVGKAKTTIEEVAV